MSLISDLLDDSHRRVLRPTGGCHNCPRKKIDFVPPTLVKGKVLFVGEAPGAEEVKQGRGFVGMSGQLLRTHIQESAQIPIEECSFTNTIHCRPPGNAKPVPAEVSCCLSQFVLDEIRGYPIVVLCGATPLHALFPKVEGSKGAAQATHFRGNFARHPDYPGQAFYSIYHPAFITRRKDVEEKFRRQMERLGTVYRTGADTLPFRILRGGGEAFNSALRAVLSSPLLSLDVETNKLESWHPDSTLRSIALAADTDLALFVHESEPHFLGVLHAVKEFLEKEEKHVLGMNTGFDLEWLEEEMKFRVQCRGKHDIGTIYYEARQYKMPSLKEVVADELDGYRFLIHHPGTEKNLDTLALYNSEDVIYPLHLFRKGMGLVSPKTWDMLVRVSGPSGYVLRRIQRNGFYLRQDYWKAKAREYEEKERAERQAWKEEDPLYIPTVHDSGKGLKRYLFDLHGLPVVKTTDKGSPSTDDGAIKQWIRDGATYLQHLLTLRKIEKVRSTYLDAYTNHLGTDGRIHSSYTNTFTDSVRSSSRTPNVQNIPRLKEIRNLFGVPPGSVLLESDLSQIEFRIMVCLARDQNGIAAYLRGEDAHTTTARSFSQGLDPTDEQRTWAKVINFSLLYGGDAYKVQQWARDQYGLSWTIAEAEEFVARFWATYPSLPAYHEQAKRELEQNHGWFESITGHRFFYEDWNSPDQGMRDHAFRSELNARAQGPAAQICFLIMIHADRLWRERGLKAKMVNTVHDSIITEISDPSQTGAVIAAVEEACEIAYEWVRSWFIVPLVMDHKIGEAWGSMTKWTG